MSRPFCGWVWGWVARLRSWHRAMTQRRRLEREMEIELAIIWRRGLRIDSCGIFARGGGAASTD